MSIVDQQSGRPSGAMRSGPPTGAAAARLLTMLSFLMAFGPMSTDMYLPAMPQMARDLNTSVANVEWTLSSFLVGFGLGQLLWGPLGDRYGRRKPIIAAILLYIVATTFCAQATSVGQEIFWRSLQALSACAGPVLARAMVRDVYGREHSARALSLLMLVMGVAPLLAPILGGQVLLVADWRGIFWVQMVFGILVLFGTVFLLKETLPLSLRGSLRLPDIILGYSQMLGNRRFLGAALAGGFFYGGVFSYLAGSPFAYVEYYHVPAQLYGLLFAVNVAGMMALNVVNRRMVLAQGPDRMLVRGAVVAALSGLALAFDGHTGFGGLVGLALPLFFYFSMLGFVSANSMACALAAFPHRAGAASALAGGMQFAFGAGASFILGHLADGTPWPMGLMVGACGVLCLLVAQLLRKEASVPRAAERGAQASTANAMDKR